MMNLRKRRGYYASKLMAALAGFTALGLSFITWAVLLVTTSEHYCAFMPAIDTHFAPGFTESRFSQIKIGMDSAQVFAVLGKPYSIMRGFEGSGYGFNTIWAYSGDGACRVNDVLRPLTCPSSGTG